jgi:hypothetical protein
VHSSITGGEDEASMSVLQCRLKRSRGGEAMGWSSRERRGVVWLSGGRRLGDGHTTVLLQA